MVCYQASRFRPRALKAGGTPALFSQCTGSWGCRAHPPWSTWGLEPSADASVGGSARSGGVCRAVTNSQFCKQLFMVFLKNIDDVHERNKLVFLI